MPTLPDPIDLYLAELDAAPLPETVTYREDGEYPALPDIEDDDCK